MIPILSAGRSRTLAWVACWALLAVVGLTGVPGPAEGVAAQTDFHVSTTGDDGDPGTADQPFRTLARAQQAVRGVVAGAAKDVTVTISRGTYRQVEPLRLDGRDSGREHAVIWRAAPGERVIISGARRVTGWESADAARGIWRAQVGTGTVSRQLYVDGQRAIRAKTISSPGYWTKTATGFTYDGPALPQLANPRQVEVVGLNEWKDHHCRVEAVSDARWTVQQPCFDNAATMDQAPLNTVHLLENAYEFIDNAREWYLDEATGWLYYKPAAGEDMTGVEVELPVAQTLLAVQGTADSPVRQVRFEGLTFGYAGWTAPSSADGYAAVQAGHRMYGAQKQVEPVAPHVTVSHGRSLRFTGSTFTHLGGAGIALQNGSQNVTVARNTFTDISGSAVTVGGPVNPTDPRTAVHDNEIADNVVDRVATEYTGSVGIFASYANATRITHNLIQHVPYTGISAGWGWSATPTYAGDNEITHNRLSDVAMPLPHGRMQDVGMIYTLSSQPGTVIRDNYLSDMNGARYGGLYLDEGSASITVSYNVVERASKWLHINKACGNLLWNNWSDTGSASSTSCNTVWSGTTVVPDRSWPEAARAVIAGSGPRAAAETGAWGADERLGDVLGSGPDAASWGEGRMDVFYRGADDHLYQRTWADSGWLAPVDRGGPVVGDPAVTSRGSGSLDVVVAGADGALQHGTFSGGTWSGLAPIPMAGVQIVGSPDLTHRGGSTLDLVVRKAESQEVLWRSWTPDARWGPWQSAGGRLSADPTVTVGGTSYLQFFGRGTDGALYQRTWVDGRGWTTSTWANRGGLFVGGPDAAARDSGHLDAFARGIGGAIHNLSWTTGANGGTWRSVAVGGEATSDPAAASMNAGRVDLFYRGVDGTLRHQWWDGAWRPASPLPQTVIGSSRDITWNGLSGDGLPDIVARERDGDLWLYRNSGGAGTSMFAPGKVIDHGWNMHTAVLVAGDVVGGDGRPDILARETNGDLWVYPHKDLPDTDDDTFDTPVKVGSGWNQMVTITAGDVNGDGRPDVIGRDANGLLWIYPHTGGTGTETFGARIQAGVGWGVFKAVLAPRDQNGDGRADLLALDAAGDMWLLRGTGGTGENMFSPGIRVGGGWNQMTAVDVTDATNDLTPDLLARDADGGLWLYPGVPGGSGTGTFGPRGYLGAGWNMHTIIT